METKTWEGMGRAHNTNLSIFGNARIDEVFKDFVSFASTKKCESLSNIGKPKSPRRQRCFVFPHRALRQQIPPTKNSKNYYYNPHTWCQWNTKHVIDVAIWVDPRTHFNLCYQGTCLSQWKKIGLSMLSAVGLYLHILYVCFLTMLGIIFGLGWWQRHKLW